MHMSISCKEMSLSAVVTSKGFVSQVSISFMSRPPNRTCISWCKFFKCWPYTARSSSCKLALIETKLGNYSNAHLIVIPFGSIYLHRPINVDKEITPSDLSVNSGDDALGGECLNWPIRGFAVGIGMKPAMQINLIERNHSFCITVVFLFFRGAVYQVFF